ncbi:MAG TPA: tRNA (adenosine(37)-N6)-threonylcarbamoyltransferase complex dimerization subunit type 1 TsaB [Candidatus Acidoferrales bacterium]|jgi:tRNA threonylcarbamoyladenosine biosynthesis protein TsaB|nr:tRNA (adenosine(37)-N6)-threonylcarbamoyltransferase complex dimerization subunit type 1 TsaB [Candidatus Acidoferrales bacterium]
MTILALEFSSEQRSAAVARGGSVLAEAVESGERNVAAFAMIEKVLGQAKMEREEIEAIAVGLGPGSYTGVRAAIALAQGWQLARGIKTTGISSVAAIAEQARLEKLFGRVNIVVDAQRGEFYFAAYDLAQTSQTEIMPLKILSMAEVQSRVKDGEILIGPEAAKIFPNARTVFPRAAAVAALAADRGDFLAAEKLEPIYLRETNFVKAVK